MKITHLTLAGLMAGSAVATPFWERNHEDRWDNRQCKPRTIVETQWRARTTTTKTKISTSISTKTKTVTVKNHWNPRPNVITTTKLRTITASGSTITVPGNPSTTTVTVPGVDQTTTVTILGEGEITTMSIPTTVTLPGEETTSTLTVSGDKVTTTITVPGDAATVTVPGEPTTSTITEDAITITVPSEEVTTTTTITLPADEATTTTTITEPTTITIPGDEVTSTTTFTEPTTITATAETVTIPGDEVTSTTTVTEPTTVTEKAITVTIPGDEITTTTTITIPGDEITTTTTVTEKTTVEGPTVTTTVISTPPACTAAVGAAISLRNPGFESELSDTWKLVSYNPNTFVRREADVGNPGYGLHFRVDAADLVRAGQVPQGTRPVIYASQTISVCPGAQYGVRFDGKAALTASSNMNFQSAIQLAISDGVTTRGIGNTGASHNGMWGPRGYPSFVVGPGVYSLEILIGVVTNQAREGDTRDIYIDNIQLTRTV
ncbi:hypothetical protein BJ508DRAFT_350748 [Ascobolus immersus RN42]|uniref:Uncharacterized protein n=1 Tax=Ascobolus immersus RN42 TaxID=1160509 RepID=A0A3N4HZ48_ASCIM|nr:hypothetical protein BJ508DRAFT_350748 [Ascobolus immersus RN42]